MATNTYAPKLPLETNDYDFVYIQDALENIRQNLKMIVLTNPGEKIMDPEYGLGIRRYLFEPTSGMVTMVQDQYGRKKVSIDDFEGQLLVNLTKQANKYNPEISIQDLQVQINDNIMYLKIYYQYRAFINSTVEISINI